MASVPVDLTYTWSMIIKNEDSRSREFTLWTSQHQPAERLEALGLRITCLFDFTVLYLTVVSSCEMIYEVGSKLISERSSVGTCLFGRHTIFVALLVLELVDHTICLRSQIIDHFV